jgi:L-asparagine transporter-like permease
MTEPSDTPPGEPYSGFPQPIVPRNGLGTASLVIAVIALVASVSVCGGVVLGAAAALMGLTARGRVNRGQADNRSVATAAIVLGIAAVVISLSMIVFWQSTGLFNEEYQRCLDQLQNKQYCEETYL